MQIHLSNTKNTRSLSDLVNVDGLSIKRHFLIRSDALNKLNEEDKSVLKDEIHLKKIIDLRCENESINNPDVSIDGVELILNPILPAERVGVSKKGNDEEDFRDFIEAIQANGALSSVQFMTKVYQEIVTSDFSNNAYANFLKLLLKKPEGPVLWHCSAGKDRAGFATILVLYLLDFKMEDIIQDYLNTNEFYRSTIDEFVNELGKDYQEVLETIFGVKEAYIHALFDSINQKYGSLDNYILTALHFSSKDKELLKSIYLED